MRPLHPPEKRLRCSRLQATALVSLRGVQGLCFLARGLVWVCSGCVRRGCVGCTGGVVFLGGCLGEVAVEQLPDAGHLEKAAPPHPAAGAKRHGADQPLVVQPVEVRPTDAEEGSGFLVPAELRPGVNRVERCEGWGLGGGLRLALTRSPGVVVTDISHPPPLSQNASYFPMCSKENLLATGSLWIPSICLEVISS